ncbi:MAG: glycosyltransferase [bacterium]|nr:glycosyltransferase [bacterium]
MRLLIITQKIDQKDDVLGFFQGWVEEFARKTERVRVIANYVGSNNLGNEIEVYSLGKERGASRIVRIFQFYKFLFVSALRVDAVFFHMCPEYVLAGALVFKILRKPIGFWYAHGKVSLKLKVAEKLSDKIFTSSPEGFRLKSNKIIITGQGIDTNKFTITERQFPKKFKIISVGRIAPIKRYEVLVEAADILNKNELEFEVRIAGAPILEKDKIYLENLKKLVKQKNLEDKIFFEGSVSYKNISEFYHKGDLLVNLSQTGSMDKVVLEAMSCGIPVLNSNESYFSVLAQKYLTSNNPQEVADKIGYFIKNKINSAPELRNIVIKNHSLYNLVSQIVSFL